MYSSISPTIGGPKDILLDLQYLDIKDSDSRKSQTDVLNGHDVESTSTKSFPISFPYVYIADNANSLDTFNLLGNSNEGPKYPNTSHLNITDKSPLKSQLKPETDKTYDDDIFNQVPTRFSKFIENQQNPNMAQRIDQFSANSSSLHSEVPRKKPYSVASKARHSTRGKRSKIGSISHSHTLSRDISDSMGSQATIFSTRQEQQTNNLGITRLKTKVKLYSAESNTSSLTRRKAIRFKKGGWLYRVQVRLKKMLNKFRYFNFIASSKRTGGIGRSMSAKRRKSKTLRRKYRANPKNPSIKRVLHSNTISAPHTNPQLGIKTVQKVQNLDDELKYLAGAPEENINISFRKSSNMKLVQISQYIDQQQDNYLNDRYAKAKSGSISYDENYLMNKKQYDEQFNQAHIKEESEEEEGSVPPPPPPPHLDPYSLAVQSSDNYNNLDKLWRSYLSHVLAKRIQLRQEISLFQTFLVNQELNNPKNDNDKLPVSDNNLYQEYKYPRSSIELSEQGLLLNDDNEINNLKSELIETGSESSSVLVDTTSAEFNKRFLNRRSVLGDMLDYESDNESLYSSIYSTSTTYQSELSKNSNSIRSDTSLADQDIGISKRYGTIIRTERKGPTLSKTSTLSPIRRSQGIQQDLNKFNS